MRSFRNRAGAMSRLVCAAFVAVLYAAPPWAQEFPNRSVRLVAPSLSLSR